MRRTLLAIAALVALSACSSSHARTCDSDRDCSGDGLVCDFGRSVCVECVREADCSAGEVCVSSRCEAPRACASSRDCPGLVCDPALRRCVECVMDTDCGAGEACADARCVPRGHDAGPPFDAGVDAAFPSFDAGQICVEDTNEVDLLFMIDNSNSMSEEQASLAAALPVLVRAIASGDVDGDGDVEFAGVGSIHVGVVTSDMGTGGFTTATCGNGSGGHETGDDGILRTAGRTSSPGCMPSYPAVFEFARDLDDPDAFASDVACVLVAGTGGCGFEQPLEAVLKAVSPAAPTPYTSPVWTPPSFRTGTGHADGLNAGFLRDDSVLAIVFVTDEEDCSTTDPDLFNITSERYGGTDLNLRCFTYPEVLQPMERFARGLVDVRRIPQRLVVGFLTSIPPDVEPETDVVDWTGVLAHPDMIEVIDPENPNRLRPSCRFPDGSVGFPPRRYMTLGERLEALGAGATAGTICTDDFVPFAYRMATAIGKSLPARCSH